MYTSTYSSSPVRTSETRPTNYQAHSYLSSNNNDNNTMYDSNMPLRRGAGYSNSASSLTSVPLNTPRQYQHYAPNDQNRYLSTGYSSSTRLYGNDNETYRPNTSRYDTSNNVRAHSHDNLLSDQYRSQSSIYNSRNNIPCEQQQQIRRDRPTDVEDDLIVKSTDLPASYEQEMINIVRTAFRKHQISNQRELAGFLKRSADKIFGPCWHCIVGRQFSSYVTHEMNGFIYFTKGQLSILLFKSGA
jgi:dynein light chain LC8-type